MYTYSLDTILIFQKSMEICRRQSKKNNIDYVMENDHVEILII